jgi:hypothetical protein
MLPSNRRRNRCCANPLRRIIVVKDFLGILWWKHINSVACAWTSVLLPRSRKPPHGAEQTNEGCHTNGIVHVVWSDWLDGREEKHDANEGDPCHCDSIDRLAPSAHCVWSRVEDHGAFVPSVCDDDRDVADIQGRRGDVENSRNRQSAANANQVETTAEDDDEPYGVDWGMRVTINFTPVSMPCQLLSCSLSWARQLTPRRGRLHHGQRPKPFSHSPTWQNSR